MNIGKAVAIFEQITSGKYTLEENGEAIKAVLDMETHNGVTKKSMLKVLEWFWKWCFAPDHICPLLSDSEVEQPCIEGPCPATLFTNADRIRGMSDEELAGIIAAEFTAERIPFCQNKPECDRILNETEDCIPESMCVECVVDWLRQPAETEGKE